MVALLVVLGLFVLLVVVLAVMILPRLRATDQRAALAAAQAKALQQAQADTLARAEAAEGRAAALAEALAAREQELAGTTAELGGATAELVAATGRAEALAARTAGPTDLPDGGEGRTEPGGGTADGPAGRGTEDVAAAALWDLELARVARRWRASVATDPDAPPPTLGADDPLAAAVGVDVAATREEAGVPVELTWALDRTLPAAQALAVLRAVGELLEAGVRSGADDLRLEVMGQGDAVLVALTGAGGAGGAGVALDPVTEAALAGLGAHREGDADGLRLRVR